jgi:pilus assembly protein CpaF
MPSVKTLHKLVLPKDTKKDTDRALSDINALVSNITFNILRDSPELVADVANGKTDRSRLETAIIKDIDINNYHFGIFRDELIKKVFDFMFGYGELQEYIEDEDISDIDGTKYNEFVIKRHGIRQKVPVNFGSEEIFDTYCKLVAVRNGGILNENDSHCRVTDEKYRLRINVSIKPRNVGSPSICIRKHRLKSYTLDDLEELGMFHGEVKEFIRKLANTDATVLFCGKGAAGKTTLLRAFINELPEMERVLIAETDAEIFPDKPYCIEQRIKKPNEGGNPLTLRDLVQDGLTMSLDTYCVGEIVGNEAWDFVKGAFTGHRGLATTHSESAEDALARLLVLSKGANIGESERTVKKILGKSIDIIFYLRDFEVVDILEVLGYSEDRDSFEYSRLFPYGRELEGKEGPAGRKLVSRIRGRLSGKFG